MSFGVQQPRTLEGALANPVNCIVDLPEVCPVCSHAVEAKYIASYVVLNGVPNSALHLRLEVVLACPRRQCQRLFVVRYKGSENSNGLNSSAYWTVQQVYPLTVKVKEFDAVITDISAQFPLTYNQAHSAEQNGLDLICGAGYRRSLEFLVKDYAKKKHPKADDEIEGKLLGSCIKEYIHHPKVKAIAARATWLGNDETHYVRKWETKDLQDLKKLIDLTVLWISLDILSDEVEKDMPDPKTAKAGT